MAPAHLPIHGLDVTVTAHPLTPESFAPFGEVVQNPRPDVHPSRFADAGRLPYDAVSANQGSAIKYQHVTRAANRYDLAPSNAPGVAVVNMFVCAARTLLQDKPRPGRSTTAGPASSSSSSSSSSRYFFEVNILERHPYTTQTFSPLGGTTGRNGYLVIVAPSRQTSPDTAPAQASDSFVSNPPDLSRLKAFVAATDQAVTYGAGTWHAPMVALGPEGTTVDFVVTQFANGVGSEDCQEVSFGTFGDGSVSVEVPMPLSPSRSKL